MIYRLSDLMHKICPTR